MAVVSERSSPHALLTKKRMELFAILGAGRDSTELALSAGNTVPVDSEMMVHSVLSPLLMVAVLDILCGMRISATVKILNSDARNGVLSGTPGAEQVSIMLLAAFAHLIAPLI